MGPGPLLSSRLQCSNTERQLKNNWFQLATTVVSKWLITGIEDWWRRWHVLWTPNMAPALGDFLSETLATLFTWSSWKIFRTPCVPKGTAGPCVSLTICSLCILHWVSSTTPALSISHIGALNKVPKQRMMKVRAGDHVNYTADGESSSTALGWQFHQA